MSKLKTGLSFEDKLYLYKNSIAMFDKRKEKRLRQGDRTAIAIDDARLVKTFMTFNHRNSLHDLIDQYAPLFKKMVWHPFESISKKKVPRLFPMQERLNEIKVKTHGNSHMTFYSEDVITEAIIGFICLIKSFKPEQGSFAAYVKNYLPFSVEKIHTELLEDFDKVYIDGIPANARELFEMQHLSYNNTEVLEEESFDLSVYKFTQKQEEVARLYSEGYNDTQIARIIGITRQGVEKHKNLIRKKVLKIHSKFQ